jgi:excinuclease ABC subunit C
VLRQAIPFDTADDQSAFAQIPAANGVFLLRGNDPGSEPYVSKSSDMRRRVKRLLAPPESQSKRLNLRERCATIEFTATGSDFENGLLLYRVLRNAFPHTYEKRLRLALSPLIRFHWENAYPRAYVTRKLGKTDTAERASTYYGPFRSRAVADKYLNDVLDLFKSRRCTFELAPDPAFPGCIYSEMKMCLAPCFKGCTDEAYFAETRRVEAFIASRGESLIAEMAAEREAASEALEFEKAATFHSKVEKVKVVAHEADEIVRRIDKLDAVIVQPALEPETVAFFRFHRGVICGPVEFSVLGMALANPGSGQSSLHTQPMMFEPGPLEAAEAETKAAPSKPESRLRESVDRLHSDNKRTVTDQMEHLALLKRWYYRGSRAGEIFFCNEGEWPWRRMLNGISRIYVSAHKNASIPEQNLLNADRIKVEET